MSETQIAIQQLAENSRVAKNSVIYSQLLVIIFLVLFALIVVPFAHLAIENFYPFSFSFDEHDLDSIPELMDGDHKDHIAGYTAFAALYTAFIALLSLTGAIVGYNFVRNSESRSKTLDFITRQLQDGDIIKMFSDFRSLRKKYHSTVIFFDVLGEASQKNENGPGIGPPLLKQEYDLIVQVLNYYETWGIGLEYRALDERMLKDWWRSSLVADFTDLYAFVIGYRDANGTPKTFEKAEMLARRWAQGDEIARLTDKKSEYLKRKHAAEGTNLRSAALFSLFKRKSAENAGKAKAA